MGKKKHLGGWGVYQRISTGDIHIIPTNDLREHTVERDCWCVPVLDKKEEMVWVHPSLDRRELYEEDSSKLH